MLTLAICSLVIGGFKFCNQKDLKASDAHNIIVIVILLLTVESFAVINYVISSYLNTNNNTIPHTKTPPGQIFNSFASKIVATTILAGW